MQSTGQGGIHNSQPVHKSVKMLCMSLPEPKIASTGQALIHLVQPMHSSSRMSAFIRCGRPSACTGQTLASAVNKGRWSKFASASATGCPPGTHLLAASPSAIALA